MKILIPAMRTAMLLGLAATVILWPWRVAATTTQAPTTQSPPGDWPMYGHDPAHTNYNPGETLISSTNVGQLVSRWQSPNLGFGAQGSSSAPSVANGKVYVGSSNPNGNNYYAFDATTGAPVWSANLGYQPACESVGIGSTAAITGTLLVVGGGDDAYYALDASDGHLLWRSPINLGPSAFPWESPLLANGRAYVGTSSRCDDPSVRGEIRALSLADGSLLASKAFVPEGQAGAGIWNSPALSPDDSTLIAVTGEDFNGYDGPYNRAMVSLDPIRLDIKSASKEGPTNGDYDFGTSPVIFHDSTGRVLVGAGHKNGTFYTYALDSIDKGPIWSRQLGTRNGMMPAYDPDFGDGGTLFIVGGSARLFAVDPATANERWPNVEANGRGNMAIANGLIFLNDRGILRIFNETNGKSLRVISPDNQGPSNSGVVVANGFVYWMSGAYLNAWSLPAGGASTPTPKPASTPAPAASSVPGDGSQTFPETGQTVSGIFLDYWKASGGLAQQGFPISGLTREKSDLDGKDYTVQYFERSVMEYHPEQQPPFNVLLSQLGTFQYRKKYPNGAPGQHANDSSGSVVFKETGKRLGGKFLEYWQSHGGLMQQGYPISDEFVEKSDLDGKPYLVQYFERAVFELHPENQSPYDVLLSQLGRFKFDSKHAP